MADGQDIKEYSNLAIHNKPFLKGKSLWVEFGDDEYRLIIKGIGRKAVKLELYVRYEDIIDNPNGVMESKLDEMVKTIFEKGAGKAIKEGD